MEQIFFFISSIKKIWYKYYAKSIISVPSSYLIYTDFYPIKKCLKLSLNLKAGLTVSLLRL